MTMCSFPGFRIYSGREVLQKSLPSWSTAAQTQENSVDPIFAWTKARTSELDVINITSALIAGVISGVFSWPTIQAAPWTSKACFYSALILALTAIFTGSQQSIALHRVGETSAKELREYLNRRKDAGFVAYIWQLPVMLLNISIWMLLLGLAILIWDRAASSKIWGGDTKIAFVATLAAIFALTNYVLGSVFIWRLNSELYHAPDTRSS